MLHYTACGLDNVWLKNGYEVKRTAYGKAVAIKMAEKLHEVIACDLVKKPGRLTGKEFRFLRTHLGLSQVLLAEMLLVKDQSVSLWERTGKVPANSDMLLRLFVQGKIAGDTSLTKALERAKVVDKLVHQKIIAAKEDGHWSSKVKQGELAFA